MKAVSVSPFWRAALALVLLSGMVGRSSAASGSVAEPKLTPPAAVHHAVPESVEELRAIQEHVKKVLAKVNPSVVALRIGQAWGSGVIIDEDGTILTAAHVSGKPDRDCAIFLPDGKEVKGKTLGANSRVDGGMVKITAPGKWPAVAMGNSSKVKGGDWCLVVGHPGGFRAGRAPVVRLGRVSTTTSSLIRTDATLVGGDSGGPLFDMEGKVIGIHSRIGMSIADNVHVPVDSYRENWDRLVAGDVWGDSFLEGFGGRRARTSGAYLGIESDSAERICKIVKVREGSPAERGGLKVSDVIKRCDGKLVEKFEDLQSLVTDKKPGDKVELEVLRGTEVMKLKVALGRRPE
jgi:serine protease Do